MSNVTTTARSRQVVATNPTIYNLSMPTAGTEYSQALGSSTKKLLVRMRDKGRTRFAFSSGDTNVEWITLEPGAVYFEENLDLNGVTIYLQSNIAGQTAEILEWT